MMKLAAGAVLVVASLAGCSSAPAVHATAPPVTHTRTVTAPPVTRTHTAPPVTVTAPSSPAGMGECTVHDLLVTHGSPNGAAGSLYLNLNFQNVTASDCVMEGFPGASLTTAMTPGSQVGHAASRTGNPNTPVAVTLAPGQVATAVFRVTDAGNYPAADCHPEATSHIQVYEPDQTEPVYLSYASTGCAVTSVNLLSISALYPA